MNAAHMWSFGMPSQLCCRCDLPVAWDDAVIVQLGPIEWPAHRDCPEEE